MSLTAKIQTVITSDEGSDAVRVWLWLVLNGKTDIDRVLEAPLPSVVPSLNALVRSARVEVQGVSVLALMPEEAAEAGSGARRGKTSGMDPRLAEVQGIERVRRALASPRSAGAKDVIAEGVGRVFRAINAERKSHGLPPLAASQERGQRDKWQKILAFAAENNVRLPDFIAFAYVNTRHMPGKFPTPGVLAGDWLRQMWLDRDDGERGEHAGHHYATPEQGLRERLREAGFGKAAGLDDKGLRHVVKLADTHRTVPHMRKRHRDPDIEAAVVWLAGEGAE